MLLRQFEYLTALAREGHFGRAAEACHVSQPALSAGIRKLEAELGVQVVQRGQRFEGFTAEGSQVLRWAQRMLDERAGLQEQLASMRSGLSGVLRIGAIPTALTVSSLLTAPMRAQHPQVQFALESMTSRQIVDEINDFAIDVGMTYVDGEPLGRVRTIPLYRERHLFLTPIDGAFGSRDSVTWAEAARAELCLLLPTMQNRRIIDGNFAEAGAEARSVVETDTVSALYSHVVAMGLSTVIPHAWLHGFGIPDGTRLVSLPRPKRTFQVGLVLAGLHRESLLTQALIDTARDVEMARVLDEALARHGLPSRTPSSPR